MRLGGLILIWGAALAWPTFAARAEAIGAATEEPSCSPGVLDPDYAPAFGPLLEVVRQGIADGQRPSVAVAVAVAGRIVWEQACGLANRETGMLATASTPYDIGSISKTFTATALMRLVESGQVDLSQPANRYLGSAKLRAFVGTAEEATVERVLHHRAGLPMHANFIFAAEPYRRPGIDESIRRYGIIVRIPNEAFNYSNMGYGVIEAIIEHVSRMPYGIFMERTVFAPLGLSHSSVGPKPELIKETAVPYDGATRLPRMDLDQRGAGYVYASVHDLITFGMFHLKNRVTTAKPVIAQASIERMVRDVGEGEGGSKYGFGWDIAEDEYGSGLTSVRHTGAQAGFSGVLKLLPQKNIAIAVLSNSRSGGTIDLSERIVAALIPEYGTRREAHRNAEQRVGVKQDRPSATFLGHWKGQVVTWQGKVPIAMIVPADGKITVQFGKDLATPLFRPSFRLDELDGSFVGNIPTPDARRDKHTVYLDRLIVHEDRMYGTAIADAGMHFALPSFISMRRMRPEPL